MRVCLDCSASIDHRGGSSKRCEPCQKVRNRESSVRRYTDNREEILYRMATANRTNRKQRVCLDCSVSIDERGNNSTRCERCAAKHAKVIKAEEWARYRAANPSDGYKERPCKMCGRTMKPNNAKHWLCGSVCREKAKVVLRRKNLKPKVKCVCSAHGCKNEFETAYVRASNYCSKTCSRLGDRAAERKRVPVLCSVRGCTKGRQGKGPNGEVLCRRHRSIAEAGGEREYLIRIKKGRAAGGHRRERPPGFIRFEPSTGYANIKLEDGGWMLHHRYVMQEHLGRVLSGDEKVHHKNKIRHDNRIKNLEVWLVSHPAGVRVPDYVEWLKEELALYEPDLDLFMT